LLFREFDRLPAVSGLTDDLQALALEEGADSLADQDVVLREQDSDHRAAPLREILTLGSVGAPAWQ
jgi:hypothetical protein